jgi:bifunctional pyridoxal-dependent enzyme with beta-cystathionase and maltose regulon repressor activities
MWKYRGLRVAKIILKKNEVRAGVMAQLVESLSSKLKVLSSNTSTAKYLKKRNEVREITLISRLIM